MSNDTDPQPSSPIVIRRGSADAFRISPDDTNYLVPLVDPTLHSAAGVTFTAALEVFEPGGKTPPNTHWVAPELFFVLRGEARAEVAGSTWELVPGDAVLVPPGQEHVIANIGDTELTTLTVMCPDEGLAELIRGGERIVPNAEHLTSQESQDD